MTKVRPIHPDFQKFLDFKSKEIISLYKDLRAFLLEIAPESNELLYHTHALTSVHTISEKMRDGFCHIPIYSGHLNLGFNKGTLLDDPGNLLQGTGKFIRHIPIKNTSDYRNDKVISLVKKAIHFAVEDMDKASKKHGQSISKIKK